MFIPHYVAYYISKHPIKHNNVDYGFEFKKNKINMSDDCPCSIVQHTAYFVVLGFHKYIISCMKSSLKINRAVSLVTVKFCHGIISAN